MWVLNSDKMSNGEVVNGEEVFRALKRSVIDGCDGESLRSIKMKKSKSEDN